MSRYMIPRGVTRTEVRFSNSRFIATIGPAGQVKEAQAFIRSIREEMPDATHHVYAFRVGHGASVTEGMSDDGEPSGTSGPPALAVVRGSGLGDVVLVITRYFGGTKLGTGGLVTAYGEAAKAAIAAAEVEEKIDRVTLAVRLEYAAFDMARRLVEAAEGAIEEETFDDAVTLRICVPAELRADLETKLNDLTNGQAQIEQVEGDKP